jgi:hypothetical protein
VNNMPKNMDEIICKYESLFAGIKQYHTDILKLQETGNNWSTQPEGRQLKLMVEKHLGMRHIRTCYTYNKRDKVRSKTQYRGEANLFYGLMSHYAMGKGNDKSKLGCWLWSCFRGKNGQVLSVCLSVIR